MSFNCFRNCFFLVLKLLSFGFSNCFPRSWNFLKLFDLFNLFSSEKRRRSWLVPACLSTQPNTMQVDFRAWGNIGSIVDKKVRKYLLEKFLFEKFLFEKYLLEKYLFKNYLFEKFLLKKLVQKTCSKQFLKNYLFVNICSKNTYFCHSIVQ